MGSSSLSGAHGASNSLRALAVAAALFVGLWAVVCAASPVRANPRSGDPLDGVRALAERWLGNRAAEVTFELSTGPIGEGHDAWAVLDVEGTTRIFGESPVALTRGLFEYLRRDAARLPSWWSGRSLLADGELGALPRPTAARGASSLELRLYLAPEAFAHAAAFWDAARWEREVDLAAMRGFNAITMPLGADRVMMAVYARLGIDPAVSAPWFSGAAFRAYGWTGQAFGWIGPMSSSFAEADVRTARRAIARMTELGIAPVLPAFTGLLPAAFAERFPDAHFYTLPSWAGLPGAVLLDPADPLFSRVAELFYEEQGQRIGQSALHLGAPLGEARLPLTAPEELTALARGVGAALTAARPGARWLVSAWPLRFDRGYWSDERVAAFVAGTDPEQVVFLDRVAQADPVWDRTQGFQGRDFLWGTTPSFGGRQRFGGRLELVGDELARARETYPRVAGGHGLLGAAVMLESPGVDPLRHDYVCDQLWSNETLAPDQWIESWVRARYGSNDARALRAWRRIVATAYGAGVAEGGLSVVASAPGTLPPPALGYDRRAIMASFSELLQVAEARPPRPALQFDLVDIGRQMLSDACTEPIARALEAWRAGDAAGLASAGERVLRLIDDLDSLLATHPGFLLGTWLESAAARAGDDAERTRIVHGARVLLTHFGPPGSQLRDSGGREWAGLVSSFHRERWRRLFAALSTSLTTGGSFDAQAFDADLATFEREWAQRSTPYTASAMGETLSVARRIVDTWALELGPEPTFDATSAAALVNESTPPLARWRIGNGAVVGGTRLQAELDFLGWMRSTFGVGFDLVEWRAEGWDDASGPGAREAVVASFDGAPDVVRAAAARAEVRLALVGSADGFGDDAAAQRSRRRQLEQLTSDLDLGALVFDRSLGALRESSVDALGGALAAVRERAPELLIVPRGVDLLRLSEIAASGGQASGPWLAAPAGPGLLPHSLDLARGRATQRLGEVDPVLLDGRAGWDDALVWQAFGLAPLFGFDVAGAPWLLSDDDLLRFARLLDLFRSQRALLAEAPSLASMTLGSGLVARGTARAQIVVVRNLTFEPIRVELPVGPSLGLDPALAYEARQWHPTERNLGRVASGAMLPITIEPFRCVLVGLSADGFDEPILEGCDQTWIPSTDGVRQVVMFGPPGGEVRVRLLGRQTFDGAAIDGVGVDTLLTGGDVRVRFDGEAREGAFPRALGACEPADLPSTAADLVRAARAAYVAPSLLARLEALPTSRYEAVARARRLARVDIERLEPGGTPQVALASTPQRARLLRVTLPEVLPPGAHLCVAIEWREAAGRVAVAARIPERGLIGASDVYGTAVAPTYTIGLVSTDAGREIDVWVLEGDDEAGSSTARARVFLNAGEGAAAQRVLVLE